MRNLVDKCIMRKIRQMHYNIEFGRYFDHEKMPPKNHKNPHTPIPKSKFHVCFTTVGYFIVTLAIFSFFFNAWKIQPPKTGSTYPQEIWSMCLSTPAKKSFNHFGLEGPLFNHFDHVQGFFESFGNSTSKAVSAWHHEIWSTFLS